MLKTMVKLTLVAGIGYLVAVWLLPRLQQRRSEDLRSRVGMDPEKYFLNPWMTYEEYQALLRGRGQG